MQTQLLVPSDALVRAWFPSPSTSTWTKTCVCDDGFSSVTDMITVKHSKVNLPFRGIDWPYEVDA